MNQYWQDRRHSRDVETAIFQYFAAGVFLWLLSGFWQLQVKNTEMYEARAARNSIKSLPIPAPRGKILDREGRVLVDNSPAFRLMLAREDIDMSRLPVLARGLDVPWERLRARLIDAVSSSGPEYRKILVKDALRPDDVAFIEAHRSEFPELELIRVPRRLYPQGGVGSHFIGYVGEISSGELLEQEFALHEPGAEVGKTGLERQYNDALTGRDGSRLMLVDSRSRRIRDLDVVAAEPGGNLRLTIDLDLQIVAELTLEGRRGAIVALDPRNGEVLALASAPTFDANLFVNGVSASDWSRLQEDPDKPMFNRALQARLAPGSIFKPFIAWAALESETVDPGFQVFCSGGATFYGRYFRCHRSAGHGWVDLERALAQSCDVYFYTVGKELGVDRIAEYARRAGFGAPTGVDLPNEAAGLVPSTSWKVRMLRDRWWPGETISVAIGQGYTQVTPMQAAFAVAGLAMGGTWHRPRLLPMEEMRRLRGDFEPPEPIEHPIRPRDLRAIVGGMRAVVNGGGTGGGAAVPGFDVCGKTGTAQRVSRSFAQSSDDDRHLDDGWFIAFAPCSAPEIALAVLYENGEHGSAAGRMARRVIQAYVDKKARVEWTRRFGRETAPADTPLGDDAEPRETP